MMMKFRSRNNFHEKRGLRKALIVSLLFIIIIGSLLTFFPQSEGIFLMLGKPFWKVSEGITYIFSDSIELLNSKQTLIDRATLLTKENNALKIQVIEKAVLESENQSLKELFNRKPESKEFMYASIVARPGFFTFDSLLLDVGLDQDVVSGALVYSTDYTPLGRVGDVRGDVARVILFSNPGEETPVIIGTSTTTPGIAFGKGGGNFEIKIPRSITLVAGDPIRFASGNNDILGSVEKVTSDPANSFQEVLFTLPVNIQHISSVLIEHVQNTPQNIP
jgi:cell shape-determining protein MreC